MRLQIGYPHNQDMPTKREKTEHQTEQQERLKTSTHSAAQVNHNFPSCSRHIKIQDLRPTTDSRT